MSKNLDFCLIYFPQCLHFPIKCVWQTLWNDNNTYFDDVIQPLLQNKNSFLDDTFIMFRVE